MKILYVCDTIPNARDNGGEQRTHWLYESLKEIGDVYVLILGQEYEILDEHTAIIDCGFPKGIGKILDKLWYHVVMLFFPYMRVPWYPFKRKLAVEQLFPGIHFDIVVKRYVFYLNLLPFWIIAPLYVDMDDYLMEMIMTSIFVHKNRVYDYLAYVIQKIFLRLIERHIEGGWISNPKQVNYVKYKHPAVALKNIPTFPSSRYIPQMQQKRMYIMTVGGMSYPANFLGIDEFLNIWVSS